MTRKLQAFCVRFAVVFVNAGRLVGVLAYVGIFVLALKPAGTEPPIQLWDKANHFIAFFVLTALTHLAFAWRKPLWHYLVAVMLYGVLIELAQSMTAYRDPSIFDLVANGAGVAAYAIVFLLLSRLDFKR